MVYMEKWDVIPDEATVINTAETIRRRGIGVEVVEYRVQALEKVKGIIPKGASVMIGSSTTLDQIGFMEHLRSSRHGWKDLHATIVVEGNEKRRHELRRKSMTADYFLGSVNAIAKTGELVACDQTGSRVGAYLFAAKNLVLVAGAQKIAEDVNSAIRRVLEYVLPLETERMMSVAGSASAPNKWIIIEREMQQNRITLILVREKLGF
jgi:hypothetical protein